MNKWRKRRCDNKKRSLAIKLLLATAIIGVCIFVFEAKVSPAIEARAMQQVHSLALSNMASAISSQVSAYPEAGNYHTLMHIERDDEGKIVMVAANTLLLNSLISSLTEAIDQALNNMEEQKITIPMMSITGSKLLSSWGPDIPVRVTGIATPSVALSDSFTAAGINQTKHSIYLEAKATIQVAVPFQEETCTVSTKVLLAEGIFIGDVPETFLSLDTLKNSVTDE